MDAISCDRCNAYTMDWMTLSIYNQTDGRYLTARERTGKWVKKDSNYGTNKKTQRTTLDLCIDCFKHMEMAIADNVGQLFFKEIIPAEEKEV